MGRIQDGGYLVGERLAKMLGRNGFKKSQKKKALNLKCFIYLLKFLKNLS